MKETSELKLKDKIHIKIKDIKRGGIPEAIVSGRKFIETVFIIATFLCILQVPFVKVNYDLTEYLPDDAVSRKAINLMEHEFGFPGTARIMINDVSIYEAYVYKQMIEKTDGVDMVSWMNEDVYMSEGFILMDKEEDYYKDRSAVMDITFINGDSHDTTKAAVGRIREMLGERGRYAGSAVENKSLEETLNAEIKTVMIMAVFLITAILALTTTSWFEPILFLSVMGVAIVINMGTNIFLGTISFLSNSIAALLQLATSMDYSVFLLHTYIRCRENGTKEAKSSMVRAIRESSAPVLSSAMTTFMGFIALCSMRFGLGKDVGLVLGKSIICSVVTVLLLMPALLLRFGNLVEKTRHRSFMPDFGGAAKGMFKARYVVLVLMVLITPFCYTAQNMNAFTFGNAALGRSPGTKAYDDAMEIEEKFGRSNMYIMIYPNETPIKERNLCNELEDLYYVKKVTGMSNALPEGIPEEFLPGSVRDLLRTRDYSRLLIYTRTDTETDLAFESSNEMEGILKRYYPNNSYIVGSTPSTMDLKDLMVPDYARTNIISLLAVGLVVAITFKSPLLAVFVLIPICVATYVNMTVPYLVGESFMFNGFMIVSCIQLGATVDYSILLTSNYEEERSRDVPPKEAAVSALKKGMLSIITSGSILTVAGYGLYFISSVSAISSLGHLVGRGALVSMAMVMLGIPALLCVADKAIVLEKKIFKRK